VKLVEVHVVCAQQAQRLIEQFGAAILGPILFLASQEDVLAVRFERRSRRACASP
jgi:hypothetical protein